MKKNDGLTKIKLRAFSKTDFSDEKKYKEYSFPINPESYKIGYKAHYDKKKGKGNQGSDTKFKGSDPETLSLEFIFDGTNTVEGYAGKGSVSEQIQELLKTAYYISGTLHRPKFLWLMWGDLQFRCVLEKVDISYTLFDAGGCPLRAKVATSFKGHLAPKLREAKENKSSPDLTHVIKFSDQMFPSMIQEIYGDDKYYMNVARANNLTSFRNIPEGKDLVFPPFDKMS